MSLIDLDTKISPPPLTPEGEQVFTNLVMRYDPYVRSVARRIVGINNWDDQDDVSSDVWLKFYKHYPHLLNDGAINIEDLSKLIGKISKTTALDHIRRRSTINKRETTGVGLLNSEDSNIPRGINYYQETPEDIVIRQETTAQTVSEIRRLTPRQAVVVYGRFYEGLSYPQISEKWRIPLGSVKTSFRIASLKLAEKLQPQDLSL